MKSASFFFAGTLMIFCFFPAKGNASFSDVSTTHVNADAIEYMESSGMVQGYTDGTFQPSRFVNRAEMAKMIINSIQLLKSHAPECDMKGDLNTSYITDIDNNAWYTPFVCETLRNSIFSGYPDLTFKPSRTINFAEAAKVLANAYLQFSPAATDNVWYRPYIVELAKHNAVPVNMFSFDQQMTRGDVAEIIYRLNKKVENKPSKNFDDFQNFAVQEDSFPRSANLPFDMFFSPLGFQVKIPKTWKVQYEPPADFSLGGVVVVSPDVSLNNRGDIITADEGLSIGIGIAKDMTNHDFVIEYLADHPDAKEIQLDGKPAVLVMTEDQKNNNVILTATRIIEGNEEIITQLDSDLRSTAHLALTVSYFVKKEKFNEERALDLILSFQQVSYFLTKDERTEFTPQALFKNLYGAIELPDSDTLNVHFKSVQDTSLSSYSPSLTLTYSCPVPGSEGALNFMQRLRNEYTASLQETTLISNDNDVVEKTSVHGKAAIYSYYPKLQTKTLEWDDGDFRIQLQTQDCNVSKSVLLNIAERSLQTRWPRYMRMK